MCKGAIFAQRPMSQDGAATPQEEHQREQVRSHFPSGAGGAQLISFRTVQLR